MDDKDYDELIKQRIGEALRNQSRHEKLDLAQLEEWVAADWERRKLKNRLKRLLYRIRDFLGGIKDDKN